MSRSWPERVRDIIEAIDEIALFTSGMTYEQFVADRRTQKAVLANFTIIGEAAANVPADITNHYLSIPWRSMREMRNVIVHVYFGVDHKIVWNTIHSNLPDLRRPLELLLQSAPN